jgi:hypothetical protein
VLLRISKFLKRPISLTPKIIEQSYRDLIRELGGGFDRRGRRVELDPCLFVPGDLLRLCEVAVVVRDLAREREPSAGPCGVVAWLRPSRPPVEVQPESGVDRLALVLVEDAPEFERRLRWAVVDLTLDKVILTETAPVRNW